MQPLEFLLCVPVHSWGNEKEYMRLEYLYR